MKARVTRRDKEKKYKKYKQLSGRNNAETKTTPQTRLIVVKPRFDFVLRFKDNTHLGYKTMFYFSNYFDDLKSIILFSVLIAGVLLVLF